MDYASLITNMGDVNTYLEDIPADVFSTGCLAYSDAATGDSWTTIAQTDKASLTFENFLERRGNCNTNWGSGYSMGTLNFTVDVTTYSNDPRKMELVFLGYPRTQNTSQIYSVKKVPYKTPRIRIHTDNGDPTSSDQATKDGDRRLNIILTNAIVDTLDKRYESEQAILDEATLRGSVGSVSVYNTLTSWGDTYTATNVPANILGMIEYNLDGGGWDADAVVTTEIVSSTGTSITLPVATMLSKPGMTFAGWKATASNDGTTATGSVISSVAKSTVTGVWTANPGTPYRIIATWTANS